MAVSVELMVNVTNKKDYHHLKSQITIKYHITDNIIASILDLYDLLVILLWHVGKFFVSNLEMIPRNNAV